MDAIEKIDVGDLQHAVDTAEEMIVDRPLPALAATFALGFFGARLLRARPNSNGKEEPGDEA